MSPRARNPDLSAERSPLLASRTLITTSLLLFLSTAHTQCFFRWLQCMKAKTMLALCCIVRLCCHEDTPVASFPDFWITIHDLENQSAVSKIKCLPALCTWAMDAVAMGTGLIYPKIWSARPPNSWSKVFLTVSQGTGAVRSKHFWNSRTYSSGNSVGDDAMNWPSLMYVAPSFSNSSLSTTCFGNAFTGWLNIMPHKPCETLGFYRNGLLVLGSRGSLQRTTSSMFPCCIICPQHD